MPQYHVGKVEREGRRICACCHLSLTSCACKHNQEFEDTDCIRNKAAAFYSADLAVRMNAAKSFKDNS